MEPVKGKFYELKYRWVKADEEGREQVNKELDSFFASLAEEDNELLLEAVQDDFARIRIELERVKGSMHK